MKNVYLFQIVSQIGPLVGAKYTQREADQGPDMDSAVFAAEMMADIMYLGMTVVTAGNAVIGPGLDDLVELDLAVGPPLLGIARLQEAAATATAVVVRLVRRHLDDVFLADYRFDDKAEIIGNRIAKALADNLAGILDGEGDAKIFIPVGVNFQPPLANPLGVILVDGSNFEVVLDIEFFQSGPD